MMRYVIVIAFVASVMALFWHVILRELVLDAIDGFFGPYVVARPDGVWERQRLSCARTRLFEWDDVTRIDAWSDQGPFFFPFCFLEFHLRDGGVDLDKVRWKHFRRRLHEQFAGLRQVWDERFPDVDRVGPGTIWRRPGE
jgi:hypothetical protein